MTSSDVPNVEAADNHGEAQNASGTDKWAKAVVEGLRSDPTDPADSESAGGPESAGGTTSAGGAGAASGIDGSDGSGWFTEPDESATEDPLPADPPAADAQPAETPAVETEVVEIVEIVDDATADEATTQPGSADEESPAGDISVEDLVIDLERVTTERDQYLDASRRLQAEFENYKKQVAKREIEARERANDSLVGELLPVLDAFDGAVANGAEDVAPMRTSFLDAMAKQGLERIDPADAPFDPTLHEAVMHEDASDTDGPVVAEVMRAGYVWKGRVLRPAMVRTRG